MANFNFQTIAQELNEVQEEGLSFEDKQLTWDTADDVADIVKALETTKIVHYLKLGGNTLGIDAAAAIGSGLEKHPEFRKALWYNMFSRRLKTETPISLKHLGKGLMVAGAKLTVLDLSDNALGPNGMAGLEDLLRSPVVYSLKVLRLNNCGLGIGGGQMLSKAILDCHKSSVAAGTPLQLKIFIAGRNRLENDGAKAIAKIFSALKTLEEIAMPQNSIYHVGIAALAAGFKENPNLRILNLNDNTVTEKGAASLAEAFAYTPMLQEINFGDCLLKTHGAYHFAESLTENHLLLEVVDLGFNEIGADGGVVLAEALQNKPNLKRINLDGNQFGYEGRERIIEIIESSANPNALESLEEDQSECEDNEEDGADEDDDDDEGDEDDEDDTTEEVDEDEDYQDEDADEEGDEAFITSPAFTTNLLNANESFTSAKNVHFDDTNTPTKPLTVESFCLSQKPCSIQAFESLQEDDKLSAFKGIIEQFSDDNRLLLQIFTTLKCAHLSQSSPVALELAKTLFKETVDYAVQTKQERRVLNYLLMQLGLLRSEEKFSSAYDLKSCRYALRETLKANPQLGSEHMRNVLNVFLQQLDV
ncbi:ran GTPase-activating protein [Rhagoletis pomonella]|uniref:ran GTPase-activating protein n=1 Tax=Rhagoletis pomonella TaxID=28610 RepID=UPI0017856F78|nr:ran GTPase-activating protein [Rhagoletis pomonella]